MIDPIYVCTVADETQALVNSVGGKYSLKHGPDKNPLSQKSTPKRTAQDGVGFQFSNFRNRI